MKRENAKVIWYCKKLYLFSDFDDNYRYLSNKCEVGIHEWHCICCGHLFISTMSTQLFVMLLNILSDRGRITHLLSPSNIMSYHRSKSVHTNLDTFYCLHEFEVFRDL